MLNKQLFHEQLRDAVVLYQKGWHAWNTARSHEQRLAAREHMSRRLATVGECLLPLIHREVARWLARKSGAQKAPIETLSLAFNVFGELATKELLFIDAQRPDLEAELLRCVRRAL